MTLQEIEAAMEMGMAIWLVGIYIIRREDLWAESEYDSYAQYASRRWGVSKRQADRWAAAGEIVLDLFPALDPEQAGGEQSVPCLLASGRPGTAISEGRLRPLVALKRSGFNGEEIREVWLEIMTHTTEPTLHKVQEEVIHAKQEALRGQRAPLGAAMLRQMIAAHVYDLVRAESDSDELAVKCRDAVMLEMMEFAADGEEGREYAVYVPDF